MTRYDRNRRRRASWARRWSAGPVSYLDRLRVAAFGGHECRPFMVWVKL
jgi:hypothetical protein